MDAAASGTRADRRADYSVSDFGACRRTALKRTAKACGPGARCWRQVGGGVASPTGSCKTVNSPMTVTRRIRRRGERAISRQTIAQGRPVVSAATCMLVCVSFAHFLHTRPRVPASTRPSLRPLFSRGWRILQNSGDQRRENTKTCFGSRHCERSEAIRLGRRAKLDCFVALLLATTELNTPLHSRRALRPSCW